MLEEGDAKTGCGESWKFWKGCGKVRIKDEEESDADDGKGEEEDLGDFFCSEKEERQNKSEECSRDAECWKEKKGEEGGKYFFVKIEVKAKKKKGNDDRVFCHGAEEEEKGRVENEEETC